MMRRIMPPQKDWSFKHYLTKRTPRIWIEVMGAIIIIILVFSMNVQGFELYKADNGQMRWFVGDPSTNCGDGGEYYEDQDPACARMFDSLTSCLDSCFNRKKGENPTNCNDICYTECLAEYVSGDILNNPDAQNCFLISRGSTTGDAKKKADCNQYCKDEFKRRDPYNLYFIEGKGTSPFCWCSCLNLQTENEQPCWEERWTCDTLCSQKGKSFKWDGESSWPDCLCSCKDGYRTQTDGSCLPCSRYCSSRIHSTGYDASLSESGSCECTCDLKNGWKWDPDTEQCHCAGAFREIKGKCVCEKGYRRNTRGDDCEKCPDHSGNTYAGGPCVPETGYVWKDRFEDTCVCNTSLGYYPNADGSACLLRLNKPKFQIFKNAVLNKTKGYRSESVDIKEYDPSKYPAGTVFFWALEGDTSHCSIVIDDKGTQIEMGLSARIFLKGESPQPLKPGKYVPVEAWIPPPEALMSGSKVKAELEGMTRGKLPKIGNEEARVSFDEPLWNCYGFAEEVVTRYVAIRDTGAIPQPPVRVKRGSAVSRAKDPPGDPLSLILTKGSVYTDGSEKVLIYTPKGLIESEGESTIEVRPDGTSRVALLEGSLTYWDDVAKNPVSPGMAYNIGENGRITKKSSYYPQEAEQWWISPENIQTGEPTRTPIPVLVPLASLILALAGYRYRIFTRKDDT